MNGGRAVNGRVLVLGRGDRAFLAVIRSLGRAGLAVDVGMCGDEEIAMRSRYVRRNVHVPPYRNGDQAWLEAMKDTLREGQYDLVIPCNDHAVIPLQRHAAELAAFTIPYALSAEAFEIAYDKIRAFEAARELGIPQGVGLICGTADFDPMRDMPLRYPVVVKPPSSFTASNLHTKRHVRRVRRSEEWASLLDEVRAWGRMLVQENFIGIGVGVEVLAKDGDVLFALQHERVHEPLEGGGSSYRRTVPLDSGMLSATRSLMKAMRYTGVAMVEFKWNPSTDEWVFIEINGRFWGSLPLAIAAGADFPRYLYEMLVFGATTFPQAYTINLYGRHVASDIPWFIANLRANHHDPVLCTLPIRTVIAEIAHLATGRERWDTFVLDDPGPAVCDLQNAFARRAARVSTAFGRRFRNLAVVKRSTAARLHARMAKARRILFVCKGNICRSPFAECYAKRVLPPTIDIISSGYYPVAGRPCPDTARLVAADFDVVLDEHRSRRLDPSMLRNADLVFVFDEENYRRVMADIQTGDRKKVFFLSGVRDGGVQEISDPYSHDRCVFTTIYRQIAECIDLVSATVVREK